MPAVDVAELIRLFPLPDQIQVIEELPIADSATVFFGLPYGGQFIMATTMGQENFASIFSAMAYTDKKIDFQFAR